MELDQMAMDDDLRIRPPKINRPAFGSLEHIPDDALARLQFHTIHENFTRASGFPDWEWPDPTTVPDAASFEDRFEMWLLGRWLGHVRSESFRKSAEYHYLYAEWERGE